MGLGLITTNLVEPLSHLKNLGSPRTHSPRSLLAVTLDNFLVLFPLSFSISRHLKASFPAHTSTEGPSRSVCRESTWKRLTQSWEPGLQSPSASEGPGRKTHLLSLSSSCFFFLQVLIRYLLYLHLKCPLSWFSLWNPPIPLPSTCSPTHPHVLPDPGIPLQWGIEPS